MMVQVDYFSGTGNAYCVAERTADFLRNRGYEVELHDVVQKDGSTGRMADIRVFVFSVLGFSPPLSMIKYLKRLPHLDGGSAVIIGVCGGFVWKGRIVRGWSGAALNYATAILRGRGYRVVASTDVSHPVNWIQMMNPPSENDARTIRTAADGALSRFLINFVEGHPTITNRCGGATLISALVSMLFRALGRRFLGKLYSVDDACTGCGLCVRSCPSSTIKLESGRPHWSLSCQGCARCINLCPERAIQASRIKLGIHIVFQVAALIAAVVFAEPVLPAIGVITIAGPLQVATNVVSGVTVFFLVTYFEFTAFEAFLSLLARIPLIRRWLAAGRTQKIGRYLAPGFSPKGPAD